MIDREGAAPPPGRLGVGAQWWLIACVTAASTVATIDKNVMALLVGPIRKDLDLTDTQMSFLLGLAFALIYTTVIIPAGPLADRFRRKSIVAAGVTLWSVMAMACGLASGYAQMFAARLGVGAGEGVIQPALVSLVRSGVDGDRRGRAYNLLALAPMIGAGLAVILGGTVVGILSHLPSLPVIFGRQLHIWQLTLLIVGSVGLPVALLTATMREPAREPRAVGGPSDLDYREAFRVIGAALPVFACIFGFAFLNQAISAAFGAWIPSIMARQYGLSPMQIGAQFGGLMVVAAPIGVAVAGWLIDRATRSGNSRAPLWIGGLTLAIVTICATIVPIAHDRAVFWTLFGLQMMVGGVPGGAILVLLAQVTPAQVMGKVSAVNLVLVGFFGTAGGPTLAALIGDRVFGATGLRSIGHGVSTLCLVSGVLGVLLMVVLAGLLKRRMPQ